MAASTPMRGAPSWVPQPDTAIVCLMPPEESDANRALFDLLRLLSDELAEKVPVFGGNTPPVSFISAERGDTKDIGIRLDPSADNPAEGFVITVRDGRLTVTASCADGLFYGCRRVLKMMILAGRVTPVSDSPDVPERAVMLDIGRKYYSPDFLRALVRELSWADMNTLILHFSEEMGLGIESKCFPWLNGRDGSLSVPAACDTDNRVLTQSEVRALAAYAAAYRVKLIPSFDSPGHMNYIVKCFNERAAAGCFSFEAGGRTVTVPQGTDIANRYHYRGKTALVQGSRNTAFSRGIDISNEIAVAFTHALLTEYAELFASCGCTSIDIGGDELLGWGASPDGSVPKWMQLNHWRAYAGHRARLEGYDDTFSDGLVAYDGFVYYMNDMNRLVRGLGFTSVRMWNDDVCRARDTGWLPDPRRHIQPDHDIDIEYWSETSGSAVMPADFAADERAVFNCINEYSYYVLGKAEPYAHCSEADIYSQWNPWIFQTACLPPSALVKGSAFCIWSDAPLAETEQHVLRAALPMIRAHGRKAWDADAQKTVSYGQYRAENDLLGQAPGGAADISQNGPCCL